MILQLERPLVFLDFETTGLDVEADRIIELAFVKLSPDGARDVFEKRVNPGIQVSKQATKVTGIHTNDACGLFGDNGRPAQPLKKLAGELVAFLNGCDLAGFNQIAYDIPLLQAECRRHGIALDLKGRCQVDAQIIFKVKETGWDRFLMGPRNLTAALRHYCGREHEGAHSALADASATVDVLLAQLRRYPDLPHTVPALHEFCMGHAAKDEDDAAVRARAAN